MNKFLFLSFMQDTQITALQTGTVVYLESIPPPSRITVGGKETSSNPRRLVEVQMALNASQDENRRKYDLQNPMVCVWRGRGGLFAS